MANDWRETVQEVLGLQGDPDMGTAPGPAIQWYPAQWSGDPAVQLMSMEARGIHHHLLMVAWRGFSFSGDPVPCSLPDDPEMLRNLCQNPPGWDSSWPAVSRAWKSHEGRLWNLGLCREYLRQMQRRRSARIGAAQRWRSERDANASDRDANASVQNANASESECTSDFSLQSSSSTSGEEKKPDFVGPRLPAPFSPLYSKAPEAGMLAELIAEGSPNPDAHRSPKQTDEDRMREERAHLLAALYLAEPSSEADTLAELWVAWRTARKAKHRSKVKAAAADWLAEVKALRKLRGNRKARAWLEILAEEGWMGIDEELLNGHRRPKPPEDRYSPEQALKGIRIVGSAL